MSTPGPPGIGTLVCFRKCASERLPKNNYLCFRSLFRSRFRFSLASSLRIASLETFRIVRRALSSSFCGCSPFDVSDGSGFNKLHSYAKFYVIPQVIPLIGSGGGTISRFLMPNCFWRFCIFSFLPCMAEYND